MHKCPKCGQEFEGNFCPECGAKWQEEKTCPQCGATLAGAARFCNECGYAFYESTKQSKSTFNFKEKLNTVWAWIKSHLKIVIPVASAVLLIIILSCAIPAGIANANNGTYYKLGFNGELDKSTYFILKSGKWEDEDGETGTYKKDGDNIIFYYTLFGETDELCSGTLKDKVLKVNNDTFISEKHKHKYGEWETTREATCTAEGMQARTCSCGVSETQNIEKIPHNYSWLYDETEHWQICSVCESESDKTVHTNKDYCAECGYYRFEYTLNDDEASYTVKGIDRVPYTNVIIPQSYNGLPVTSIGNSAFSGCSGLTNIIIPNSVTSIGNSAFSGCSGLTNIIIPNSVTSIGNSAFYHCSSLTSITIPKSVTSIGYMMFVGCSGLTNITIPNSITYIGYNAFAYCSGLTSVTIGNGVTSIYDNAFEDCSGLTSIEVTSGNTVYHSDRNCLVKTATKTLILGCKNSVIPTDGSITSIGSNAFDGCSGLTGITIPDSVTSIGKGAFSGCTELIKNIDSISYVDNWVIDCGNTAKVAVIKEGTKGIANSAFEYCRSLTSVIIPDSVTSIGSSAFEYCSGLTSISIPDSVTSIGSSAFEYCSGLTSISIPDSVTSIGSSAFAYCSSLNYNEYDNAYYLGNVDNSYVVLIESKDTSITDCAINNKTKIIYNDAFGGCRSLTSITIPDSVKSINSYAFSGCSDLTDINFSGTQEQWVAINKVLDWNYYIDTCIVHCTDGDIVVEWIYVGGGS